MTQDTATVEAKTNNSKGGYGMSSIDWKLFNDTFEAEIKNQEFEIDESQWLALVKSLKVAQEAIK